jgi:hypothetical protein
MNPQNYKAVILVITAVSALFVASPALQKLLVFPQTEFFTELWILGPEHRAENYPYNITANSNYNVFLGIGNHLGHTAYYQVRVKFRSQNQSAPSSFDRTPSNLPALFSINAFVPDKQNWELPLTFSLDYVYDQRVSRVSFNNLVLNGNSLVIHGYSTTFDNERKGYLVNVFFELWVFDDSSGAFNYHERFAGLWLNVQP